ncbi:MAG TPA: cupin-like domain-containing protein [Steroidobacteraceae bacterium]|nr:cupin-like domain-containing protein [Steroidobacteraceae bacterium]
MNDAAQILVRTDVDLKTFREEIRPAAEPVVFKGLVSDWPVVRAARESPRALADAIRRFDRGRMPNVIEIPAAAKGQLFYRDDLSGLNFQRRAAPIGATLDRLLSLMDEPDPVAVFIESMVTQEFLPDFAAAHPMPLVDAAIGPRIWIGNRTKVQTHFDLQYNIACVVGGRRRFTLFPPEQVANLYIGPLEYTPSGTPVSMVLFDNPDLTRYPRFAEALRHARQAELEPGDAIYIPYAWWHHVEALTPFNVLVNYWWNDAPKIGSAYGVLLHAAMSLRDLPADQRAAWKPMFDVLVFSDPEESLAHLPPAKRGLMGPPSAQRSREIREILRQTFSKPG